MGFPVGWVFRVVPLVLVEVVCFSGDGGNGGGFWAGNPLAEPQRGFG